MHIVPSLTIGANIEHLREPKLVRSVHLQEAIHEDQHGAVHWPILHIEIHVGVLHGLEAQRLDLLGDILEAVVLGPSVGHRAELAVEADQLHALAAGQTHGLVVVFEEESCQLLGIHRHC